MRTRYLKENTLIKKGLKKIDHLEWNSEDGHVQATIIKKITSTITFKDYKVHASKAEPQYVIKNDTTNHLATHEDSAFKKFRNK